MAIKTVNDQGGLLTWRQSFVRIISACLLPALCALLGVLLHGSKFAILVATVLGFLFNFLFCLFLTVKGLRCMICCQIPSP